MITSLQNLRVKELVRLRRKPARREREILIDGGREIARAFDAGIRLTELFHGPADSDADVEATLIRRLQKRGVPVTEVSRDVFAKIAYGERTEGILATAERPMPVLTDLKLGDRPLVAVVECIEKPGNLGAILRSADGAGVGAVIVVEPATDVFGPNVIRASVGAVFCVPVVEAGREETMNWLKSRGIEAVAAHPAGNVDYTEVNFCAGTAVVLGAEATGLSSAWLSSGLTAARVPMRGKSDSLNVSITAAVFFYEALRQRTTENK